ncbi:hypothetical protein SPSIL_058310 [Sporomusa silvacetica DSM 10669]|uniref:Uncharacterized protein n=1 Tax=Sporomusa silvacetica DSM 10669 TaxID=1123289 RepID=A0ABZ3IVX8_9FIRM|nr:hypothetical protein [Sporomusa silvacetica]OZC14221.1 hypothetical protein SPSIL_49480 [Sporomusa silvacetica DSM 10669]
MTAKDQILVAIYLEYQKDIPDMTQIKATNLGLDHSVFKVALKKLDNELMVNGLKFLAGGANGIPADVYVGNAQMAPSGIKYVENILKVRPEMSKIEKIQAITSKATEWGWEQMKDISAKVLAEIIKSQIEFLK